MVSDEHLRIVRMYELESAPTGEGTRYECNDGSVWHVAQPFEMPRGRIVGDVIIPYIVPPNRG